jgi:glyoxylate/hydroxypyruvate reductase A
MTLLIASGPIKRGGFADGLREINPTLDVRVWPNAGDIADIRYALVWKPPEGMLATLTNLEVIFSIGAGVDHLLTQSGLPDVPLVRFVDPNLTMRMSEYVCLHVLTHHRRMQDYAELQARGEWKEFWPQPGANEVRVGIMGLGVLGLDAVEKLTMLGYDVAGWSRSQKQIDGVECFAGKDGLKAFLARTDILVCLLPHTPDTQGMLNSELISGLAKDGPLPGPVLINAGRGKVQVEADILSALEAGDLWAASLDVFEEEPLSSKSPLWAHPRVIITPHNASISDDMAVCRYVADQIARYEKGEALENVIDLKRGY